MMETWINMVFRKEFWNDLDVVSQFGMGIVSPRVVRVEGFIAVSFQDLLPSLVYGDGNEKFGSSCWMNPSSLITKSSFWCADHYFV